MTRNKNRSRPTYTRAGTPRRIRGDARLERLDATQRDRLRHWLERENLTYAAVVVRLRDEFGLRVGKSALGVYYQRHILAEHDDLAVTATAFLAALPKDEPSPLALHRAQALAFSALCQPQPEIRTAARLLDVVYRARKRALARERLALAQRRAALRAQYAPDLRTPISDLPIPTSNIAEASAKADTPSPDPRPRPPDPTPAPSPDPRPYPLDPTPLPTPPSQKTPPHFPRFPGYSSLVQPCPPPPPSPRPPRSPPDPRPHPPDPNSIPPLPTPSPRASRRTHAPVVAQQFLAPLRGHSPPPLNPPSRPHLRPRFDLGLSPVNPFGKSLELPAPCAVRPLRPSALAVHLLALP